MFIIRGVLINSTVTNVIWSLKGDTQAAGGSRKTSLKRTAQNRKKIVSGTLTPPGGKH